MQSATTKTVLGVASLASTLPVVGLVLVLLFVAIKPEATAGFSLFERLGFWTAHIGLGLASILFASRLFRLEWFARLPFWLGLALTALAGAALLAPVYLFLETLVPAEILDEPDDWLDLFAAKGLFPALLAEYLEVVPVFLVSWLVVNLPLLLQPSEPDAAPPSSPDGPGAGSSSEGGWDRDDIRARLPHALGTDVIMVSSDMHYLHVHTTRGKCMIHGALKTAASHLGDLGMLVHRSHWVAHRHVQRVAKQDSSVELVLTNELRAPVSRRNRATVNEMYGKSANVVRLRGDGKVA